MFSRIFKPSLIFVCLCLFWSNLVSWLVFCTEKTWYNCSHFSMNWYLKSLQSTLCSPVLFRQLFCSLLLSDAQKVSTTISTTLQTYFRLFYQGHSPNTSSQLTSTFGQVIWQYWLKSGLSFWYHSWFFLFYSSFLIAALLLIFRQYSSNAIINNKKLSQTGKNILTP